MYYFALLLKLAHKYHLVLQSKYVGHLIKIEVCMAFKSIIKMFGNICEITLNLLCNKYQIFAINTY